MAYGGFPSGDAQGGQAGGEGLGIGRPPGHIDQLAVGVVEGGHGHAAGAPRALGDVGTATVYRLDPITHTIATTSTITTSPSYCLYLLPSISDSYSYYS